MHPGKHGGHMRETSSEGQQPHPKARVSPGQTVGVFGAWESQLPVPRSLRAGDRVVGQSNHSRELLSRAALLELGCSLMEVDGGGKTQVWMQAQTRVKRAVVQVISAMAHHGYLEQPGGEAMIEYIVQQCALPPEQEDVTITAVPTVPQVGSVYLR
ncbi:hypothetical protein P7K49_026644 [Saguinus oedipus]|uniref:MROH2B-like HEAT-repeats domain-containing protein n=1 Tax=Saguinus oedipus TaxID=9490 RepID=A0ABQ9UF64_SAGOE|nr:hypothetical protein P7K49_026644 [Saguinus oedipus]